MSSDDEHLVAAVGTDKPGRDGAADTDDDGAEHGSGPFHEHVPERRGHRLCAVAKRVHRRIVSAVEPVCHTDSKRRAGDSLVGTNDPIFAARRP